MWYCSCISLQSVWGMSEMIWCVYVPWDGTGADISKRACVFETDLNRWNVIFTSIKSAPVFYLFIFFRCGRWGGWLARLWRGPVSVFRYTDEDMWEAREGRTLCSQQPRRSPHDQLLWAAAEQSATTGWVSPQERQDFILINTAASSQCRQKAHVHHWRTHN